MQVRVDITETEASAAGEDQPRDISATTAARTAKYLTHSAKTIESQHLLMVSRVALYLANGVIYWPGIRGQGRLQTAYNYLAPRYVPAL